MRIGPFHGELAQITENFTIEALAGGKVSDLVDQALAESHKKDSATSVLAMRFAVWFMIGLSLWRADSIPAVFARLISGLRDYMGEISLSAVTDSALSHMRRRLGVGPMRRLFEKLGELVVPPATFQGLRVWIMDGTRLTLQDTAENLRAFRRQVTGRGRAAFCRLKMVVLVDAAQHLIRGAVFGLWNWSEVHGARALIRYLKGGDLVILDRGLYSLRTFLGILESGAQFLCRAPSVVKLRAIRGTKAGKQFDAWIKCYVPLEPSDAAANQGRSKKRKRVWQRVRVIDYRLRGHGRVRLVTSLMDRERYTAADLAVLYHRRWEAEIAFDELKIHQNANAHGQLQTTLRSKTPRNVMQEAYALLVTYNLVRSTIKAAADRNDLDARRFSFLESLRCIQLMIPRMQAAKSEKLPGLYRTLLDDVAGALLDRFRRPRAYPRVVRIKMSDYKLKRPHHHQELTHFESMVREAVA
jgi:hypothetical protein